MEEELMKTIKLADKFLNSLPKGWLSKIQGDVGALNDFYLSEGYKSTIKGKK